MITVDLCGHLYPHISNVNVVISTVVDFILGSGGFYLLCKHPLRAMGKGFRENTALSYPMNQCDIYSLLWCPTTPIW